MMDKLQKFCVISLTQGGAHADNTVDLQEFMIMPVGMESFAEGLRMCSEVYHTLKTLLKTRGCSTAVGDEGGFAPDFKNAEEVLTCLTDAVLAGGYEPGKDFFFAIDAAASELYDSGTGRYVFPGESRMSQRTVSRSSEEMVEYFRKLTEDFPICSIEDGLAEEDWEGWKLLTRVLGKKIQLVGDDLFVTNTDRLSKGIREGAANAVLIKMNQIGTLTETLEAMEMAKLAGYRTIVSHRSGETEDTFLADLAVAAGSGQIKTGAPCRSERVAKYNRLLRIEEEVKGKRLVFSKEVC